MNLFRAAFLLVVVVIMSLEGGFAAHAAVYGNTVVNFNQWSAWTNYGTTQVNTDFGNTKTLQGGDRIKINANGELRFFMPKGKYGSADAGGIIKSSITEKTDYTMEYKMKFSDSFPWSKGGKIPGLSGGAGYTGGNPAWPGDGFSVRLMWRENGRLIPYVYHMDQPDSYGDTFGATVDTLKSGQWYTIKYWIKLNSGNNKDGVLKIYVNDVLKFQKSDIRFRNDNSKIDTIHIANFPGGSDSSWAMKNDGYVYFDDFKWN
ncbi:polysaccharide lyase [Paenibacillus radicis (ex Xue et al. 2023)]|uniref:Polysaccharide lyase 14 domain-containing protein n=1 Tax=Paenibacillus radicis (ex Xue et al. 2023) TaxID=2972489 RepID=A0ABT1YTD9_9BACL|nr:hypothetical protein [Paenibacillus radicis (ex Xue et al. 2023)]MCR8636454.1 hypothetical protein [Paenibacillus radicis (ex Xue et al. 2023)]